MGRRRPMARERGFGRLGMQLILAGEAFRAVVIGEIGGTVMLP